MSDEVVSYCGTGGWSGPKPGDPDNNLLLTATPAYGGVDVKWSYPTLNPHAVSHVLLYRGLSSDFSTSSLRVTVSGDYYYDRIPKAEIREYFYWIQVVSVNGTVGDVIGPASAVPMGLIHEVVQDLTGLIDAGALAQSLKEKIDRISVLDVGLNGEIINRIRDNESLTEALDYVLTKSDTAVALIQDETTQRLTADEGLINSLNVMAVGLSGNAAAILEEKTTRVTKEEAVAQQINILYTETANNTAAIQNEQIARSTQDQAITTSVNTLAATTGQLGAAIQTNATAITDAKSSFTQQLNTAQSLYGTQLASVQTQLTTSINAVDNKANAMYTAKVDVNGLIGGFGIYNNSQNVEAGFDVDRFWIGRTTNKVKPFIIDSGTVYMDKARIRNADIDTLKIAGNAVTVPLSTAFTTFTGGSGVHVNAAVLTITSGDAPLNILGMFSARVGYTAGLKMTGYRVVQDGVVLVDYGYMTAFTDFPSFSFAAYVPVNTTSTISVQFWGEDSTVSVGYRSLTLFGVKR